MSILKNVKQEALVTLITLTLAGLAPIAVSAAPKMSAAGGHGGGNGGDSLEMTSADGDADVEISVPEDLGRGGMLEIVGTPGAGQDNEASLAYCESDSQGLPTRHGCKYLKAVKLNESTTLSPGLYLISYSETRAFVQVHADQKTVATLKKLKVAKASRPVSFTVFVDLTDPAMQDKALLLTYSSSSNQNLVQKFCRYPNASNKDACDAIISDNYRALLNRIVYFDANGAAAFWFFSNGSVPAVGYLGSYERVFVKDPEAGDFLSVFPGVYGVTFTDSQTGKTETRYGIRVN